MVLLVGFCFGQTIADLNAEQKLQYNRNKLSIDVVQKTIGGVAGNAVHSESWNQWTAYKGLRNKINEYEFFTITGYENEANTIKENYIKSKSKLVNSKIMFGASLSLYAIGWFLIDDNLKLPILIGSPFLGVYGFTKYLFTMFSLEQNFAPYSAVKPIMEEYNKDLIKDIYNNKE